MKKVFAAMAAVGCMGLCGFSVQAAPPIDPASPMTAPVPPRMLDPATSTVEDVEGTLSTSQREHCRQLLDKLNAMPSTPQWSKGKSSVQTAEGLTYPTLERAPDRKRLEEAYRQECAQERK
ncbi:hypothetical protein [Cupriavidus pauculus]|uniref:hypothetical protein n=1 Tax=Cupriavidus pauculus TaxID=82633 RepID=UPI003857449E